MERCCCKNKAVALTDTKIYFPFLVLKEYNLENIPKIQLKKN